MNSAKSKLTDSGAKLIVSAFAIACTVIVLAVPTPLAPHRPTLRIQAHTSTVKKINSTEADTVRKLYLEQGVAEAGSGESPKAFEARTKAISEAVSKLGKEDVIALRQEAVAQLFAPLSRLQSKSKDDTKGDEGVLGSFPKMLARYGLAKDGQLVGPKFVIQSLFKARWNSIHQFALTDGFSDDELYAYWGWLAVESDQPTGRRKEALDTLSKLKESPKRTVDMLETRAFMAAESGANAEAATWYNKAYEASGSFRLRNHALYAQALAL